MANTEQIQDILKIEGINAKGFGIIAKLVMQDTRLTIEAKAIYSYFCSYAGNGSSAFPSLKTILSHLGISKDRYYKHFNLLKDYGYIKVEQRLIDNKFSSNLYTLVTNPVPCFKETGKVEKPIPCFEDTEIKDTQNKDTNINKSFNKNISFNNNNISSEERETDPVYEKVNAFYKEQYGKDIKQSELAKLCTYYKDPDIIIQAIKRAKEYKGNTIKYILSILKNWKTQKIVDVKDLEIKNKSYVPQHSNFEQRKYTDEELEGLYENV